LLGREPLLERTIVVIATQDNLLDSERECDQDSWERCHNRRRNLELIVYFHRSPIHPALVGSLSLTKKQDNSFKVGLIAMMG
jgi:hypothetical protein